VSWQPHIESTWTNLLIYICSEKLSYYFDMHLLLDRLTLSYCSTAYYHLRLSDIINHLLKRDASLALRYLDYCNARRC